MRFDSSMEELVFLSPFFIHLILDFSLKKKFLKGGEFNILL